MSWYKTTAFAKINLHLQVLGNRPDGYHEIRTLIQSIDLADEIRGKSDIEGTISLQVNPKAVVSEGRDNLVIRAAELLHDYSGIRAGARLLLQKRIPVGAGLGGGSADAAATLVLLDSLWNLNLGPGVLLRLASQIGSDVPYFLHGGLALGVGRGEEVYPLADLPIYGVILVLPSVELSTAEVFNRLPQRLTWEGQEANVYAFAAGLTARPCWQDLRNDLEPEAISQCPEVGLALDLLRSDRSLHTAMTGSGSAVFAIYPDLQAARYAASDLGKRWRVYVGSILDRDAARLDVRKAEETEEERA